MFLKNQWYVAAWSKDIGRALVARKLLGENVVLYRLENGTPAALLDRCPHRNLPLSAGKLLGDRLQCGYHGLEFNHAGACVNAPGNETIPPWCHVHSFPVQERYGWLFIWMGDPELADPGTVPEFHSVLEDADWGAATGQLLVKCGYKLMLDNLLDLSHLAYVHSSTTGNADLAAQARIDISSDGPAHVRQSRIMRGIQAAPALVHYGGYDGPIDRWQVTNFHAPAYIDINNGSRIAGNAADQLGSDTDMGNWGFRVFHAITPETQTTSHQFWAVPFHKTMVSEKDYELWDQQMANVLREDHDVYVLQQGAIDDNPLSTDQDVMPGGALTGDKGLYRMRMILDRLLKRETRANA